MSKPTASIVLYNTPEHQLTRLLDCIWASSVRLRVYVVDNSSIPLTYSCLQHPDIVRINPKVNGGYGTGHNIALRKVIDTAEFHFVLNPDIYFEPAELEKMFDFVKQDPAIGQVMPKVIYPDGSLQYLCKLLPTPVDLFLRRFPLGFFRQAVRRQMERFELRSSGYDTVMDVPSLSGCFILFRVSALKKIGMFDERFFMYMEDIDISRRMHAEFRTVFYPDATVVHDHSRESYKSIRAMMTHIHNSIRYFNKWGWIWDAQRSKFNRETLNRLDAASQMAGSPAKSSPGILTKKR